MTSALAPPFSRSDPFALFDDWLAEAGRVQAADPTAMALATVDDRGNPNVRMVLLKGADARGLVFYTNLESRKAKEIEHARSAALCFHWAQLQRQVRARGPIAPVSDAEADAYFASRERGSQIGAWASRQSAVLENQRQLTDRVAEVSGRYARSDIPRPNFWSGFRLTPLEFEFWQQGENRLHKRLRFTRGRTADAEWAKAWLYP